MLETWNPNLKVVWSTEEENILNAAVLLTQTSDRSSYVKDVLHFLYQHSGADVVMICRKLGQGKVKTLHFLVQGQTQPVQFAYNLEGTPCSKVNRNGAVYFPYGVQAMFPNDADLKKFGINSYFGAPLVDSSNELMGIITLLHQKTLPNPNLLEYVITILSPLLEELIEELD